MIKGYDIICISSIDWDFVWQGHQEIMSTFAKSGNRILFIENTGVRMPNIKDINRIKKRIINWIKSTKGFREEVKNLYIYSPIILPLPYSKIIRLINRRLLLNPIKRWMKVMEFHNPIIWTFLPTRIALDIIESIDYKLLVYYCIADFEKLVDNPKKVRRTEDELIKKCNPIFVQGKFLEERCRRFNKNVYIYPFGVNVEAFACLNKSDIPEDIKQIKKPIIGYIGGIHEHIDFDLIGFLAQQHPDWSIVLIGPIQTDISKINKFQNIFFLEKKDFPELPSYVKEFGVCIIPYKLTDYTKTVYPTKLNEYHMMGKPVVSTFLPEVIAFNKMNDNLIIIAKTKEEFVGAIAKALQDKDENLIEKRIESAKRNNWLNRIEEMSGLIREAILEKELNLPFEWQRCLIEFYRLTRRRLLKVSVILLVLYGLIFYTPLIWFVGRPLKISQLPQRADAIVVFAGGVGESGKPAQGYEERVERGIELYRDGYASNLIFVSGFSYVYKEPYIMKTLAVSLGVPQEAISLEERGVDTHQYIYFLKQRLKENNWQIILLVSSPYHMRRASLVFKKIAPEIKVIFTPVTHSVFYHYGGYDNRGRRILRQISLQQIKAVMHEYLGIVYYYFKGYI